MVIYFSFSLWCALHSVRITFTAESYLLRLFFLIIFVRLSFNTASYLLFLQEHHIQTNHGSVSVAVYGDHDKPALITYPDVALNRKYSTLV
jgi:hypothetical protein